MPEIVSTIRDRLLAQSGAEASGGDHVFDLPAELSKAITGFRHDEEIEALDGDAFVVLERVPGPITTWVRGMNALLGVLRN